MRLAYADPPYIGQAMKHYGREEVDHEDLIALLGDYDGWALSCSVPSLYELLPLCDSILPERPRIAAWVKPFASFKPGVNPAFAWEPLLFWPARKRPRTELTVRDWIWQTDEAGPVIACNITLKKGLSGAKPEDVCCWLFDLMGASDGDTLDDMFPGTGVVGQCWGQRLIGHADSARPRAESPGSAETTGEAHETP